MFWGEELVLLHNAKWDEAGGINQQGQRQRGSLSADAFNGISSSLHGGEPRKLSSQALLRSEKSNDYTVLLSPLFEGQNGKEGANGVLAQLLPKPDDKGQTEEKGKEHSVGGGGKFGHSGFDNKNQKGQEGQEGLGRELDISKLGTVVDNVPLDEHPFFHRFAEAEASERMVISLHVLPIPARLAGI